MYTILSAGYRTTREAEHSVGKLGVDAAAGQLGALCFGGAWVGLDSPNTALPIVYQWPVVAANINCQGN